MIYAILDGSPEIGAEHVEAALAVWRYCADSAGMLFGRSTGDHKADVVIAALRAAPKGLTRSEIGQGVLSGHTSSKALGEILDRLVAAGIARRERVATDGRHAERYFAHTSAEKA